MLQILTIQLTGQPLTQIQEITGKLAVGILRWVSKQWGKAVGTNVSVVNFPITFTSTPYVGYLTRTASGNSGNNTVIVRNITTTQLYGEFAYGGSDKGVYWLVIGK